MTTAGPAKLATLLPNGQVLVAAQGQSFTSAELYTPSTGTWTATGSLTTDRANPAMALLGNGQVLAAGGYDTTTNTPLASAELYTPGTGTWTLTGSMSTARNEATGTPLSGPNCGTNCGKVLVVGGVDASNTVVSTAELYTPATGTWAMTGSMTEATANAKAVLLGTGKVLVVDGGSAQLYDPSTGTWAAAGNAPNIRSTSTVTLLQSGKVLVFEGASSTASLYNPTDGKWSASSFTLHSDLNGVVATLLSTGKVLFTGGLTYSPRPTHTVATATLYDPATDAAESTGAMLIARYEHSATLLPNGQVLVAGGNRICCPSAALSEAELYTP
jgi:hypothetical protein